MLQIIFRPWDGVPNISPGVQVVPPFEESRILLSGCRQLVWFLGERVVRQTYSPVPIAPMDPPVFILDPSKVPDTSVDDFLRGLTARELVFAGVNYKNWVQARLRPFPKFVRVTSFLFTFPLHFKHMIDCLYVYVCKE